MGLAGCRPVFVDEYLPAQYEVDRQERLYRLLDRVGAALRQREIPFWAIGGTMLGAVRHQGMIPWDDDVDIALWSHDLARAQAAIREDLGGWTRWREALRHFSVEERARPDIVLDVFPVALIDGAVRFVNPLARARWHREFLTPVEFGAPALFPFGPTQVPLVGRPCSYLDRVYPEWDTRGRIFRHYRRPGAENRVVVRFDPAESRRRCRGSARDRGVGGAADLYAERRFGRKL